MEDLQESLVDVRLTLKAVFDLVDIVDGVVELHGLVVLQGWASGRPAEGRVELHRRRAGGGVRWDGRTALAAGCQHLGLKRLRREEKELNRLSWSRGLKKNGRSATHLARLGRRGLRQRRRGCGGRGRWQRRLLLRSCSSYGDVLD